MALHFTRDEYDSRIARTQQEMQERNLDALLLFAQESMYWLTGYDTFGFCFFQCLVLTADGRMALLTRSADLRQARHTSILEDIRIWRDEAGARPALALADMLRDIGLASGRLGIETQTAGLSFANGKAVHEALGAAYALEDASGLVDALRVVKSAAEIEMVRRAAALGDEALDEALGAVAPGADEGEILARMQGAVFRGGGDYPGNEFIIGSGADALLCRYKAGRRRLDAVDQITLEFAGVWRRYHAALMRTICVGEASAGHEAMHAAAQEALLACEAEMRPGRSFGDVFAAHARVMDAHGLSAHKLNACGYSLGARFTPSWMDPPMFYRDNPAEIVPGQVLFAHMILMDSETGTAMTLGRTSLVGETGAEPLSRHSLDLVVRR